jgi:hypothetical protein
METTGVYQWGPVVQDSDSMLSNFYVLISSKPWTAVELIFAIVCVAAAIGLSIEFYRRRKQYLQIEQVRQSYLEDLARQRKSEKKKNGKKKKKHE